MGIFQATLFLTKIPLQNKQQTFMGLDVSHNAYSASYGTFGRWREFIAKQIGIDLNQMEGFGGTNSWDNIQDDLVFLLNHSDCDGEILPADAKGIAIRLKEILKNLPESSDENVQYFKKITEQFIKGCELASKKKQCLKFS
jgi:hypothetical protein